MPEGTWLVEPDLTLLLFLLSNDGEFVQGLRALRELNSKLKGSLEDVLSVLYELRCIAASTWMPEVSTSVA